MIITLLGDLSFKTNWKKVSGWSYVMIDVLRIHLWFCEYGCISSGCRDGAVVRALASHQWVPGSIPRSSVLCGLSSLLCTERFSPGTPVSPLLKNHHLTWSLLIVNKGITWLFEGILFICARVVSFAARARIIPGDICFVLLDRFQDNAAVHQQWDTKI